MYGRGKRVVNHRRLSLGGGETHLRFPFTLQNVSRGTFIYSKWNNFLQLSCKFGKHAGKPTNPTKLLTVGRRSRPSHVLPWGDTNIGQFLISIPSLSEIFVKKRQPPLVSTSGRVYTGIGRLSRQYIFLHIVSIIFVRQVSGDVPA